jgi:hypothetical protein
MHKIQQYQPDGLARCELVYVEVTANRRAARWSIMAHPQPVDFGHLQASFCAQDE